MTNRQDKWTRLLEPFYDSSTVVQIVNLLFATTLVTFFMYVIFFVGVGQAGNGGEYWGFDGAEEARFQANDSFDAQDYRFLRVKFDSLLTGSIDEVPAVENCDNHPLGSLDQSRLPIRRPMHGRDSVRLAMEFARRYNAQMVRRLNFELGAECDVVYGYL